MVLRRLGRCVSVVWVLGFGVGVACGGTGRWNQVLNQRSMMVSEVDAEGYPGARVLTDLEKREQMMAFCRSPHGDATHPIKRLYYAAGWHGFGRVSADDQALKVLIRQVHDAGMEIYNLQGYHGWVLPGALETGVRIVDQVLAFNRDAGVGEGFDGIILDIEPHVMSLAKGHGLDWKRDQKEIWGNYIKVLERIARRVRRHNRKASNTVLLGECIPTHYPGIGRRGYAGFQDVMDRVDFVWLMCYRDQKDSIINDTKDEVRYAKRIGKPIVLGLCVNPPGEEFSVFPGNTFWDQGLAVMEKTIDSVRGRFKKYPQLGELSLFSYSGYEQMQP